MFCGLDYISNPFDDGLASDVESDWPENEDISASFEDTSSQHRSSNSGPIVKKVKRVLQCMTEQGLDIAQFLDAGTFHE